MNDARTGAIANGGATDDNVDSGPIRVGAMLFTLVDPTPGFEVAYNRWYERDHFYGGVMVGPGTLSGRRWVATRALKDLRFPTEPSGHSPVTNPIDAGSFLATYFIDAASVANHFAWASEEVHKLYAAGRGFEERTHAHTVLYTMRAAHHRDVAPIPAHLALDHPYAGLASIHVDRADGVSTTDLDAWLDGDGRDVVLGGGSPVDQVLSWRPIIPDREGPMDLGSGPGGKDRSLLLCFLDQQVEEAWDHLVAFSEAIEAAGIARVALTAPFTPAIPGTDTYCDQLF
ncbi:MAG: hypothetical protein IPG03_15540 [Candidatus Microthrix sp.]|nr:hypothetical protein [Candidatus Microthrix sp.]MBK6503702.1 hypothetical protein [Candidatus Microthrix sp.]